ncbi:glycosyltransferase family 4 protein [Thaumasiovibrio subtropicus]|uniref:glycosyltransferase family 4 protein n=1 Tax=Thaumasiovibrio subtropicus TaxID=1891207 RepID=UPI000B34DE5A|nr:glycosyltransferase family 4 protein [Thaumasiovibrio subtropicus]
MKTILLLDSSGFGGIESHVLQLAEMLKNRNKQVEVWFYQQYANHPLYIQLQRANVSYDFFQGSSVLLAKKLLSLNSEDCVHAHGYKASIMARTLLYFSDVKVITTFHAGEIGDKKIQFYEWLNRKTAFMSENIAVSEAIREKVGERCQLVNNFVDTESIPSRAFHSPNRPLSFAFVGRLSEEKGLDRFISLSSQFPHCQWHIFGDGPLRYLIPNQDNLIAHGAVESMRDYWSHIDVLLMPSRQEGLPMAAIEAMAHGTLVVSTDVGNLHQLVDKRFLVAEPDWQMMPVILDVMCQWDTLYWRDYQIRAQKRIQQSFSSDALWNTYQAFYGYPA